MVLKMIVIDLGCTKIPSIKGGKVSILHSKIHTFQYMCIIFERISDMGAIFLVFNAKKLRELLRLPI